LRTRRLQKNERPQNKKNAPRRCVHHTFRFHCSLFPSVVRQ
jgi:hypothetical protein